jgi:hypothetical protein
MACISLLCLLPLLGLPKLLVGLTLPFFPLFGPVGHRRVLHTTARLWRLIARLLLVLRQVFD